ncbi:MAG TPA: hypothetical protein VKK79_25430 [Candidatus Lokiarchaeia archaeon]|nr:hypothetical protein [Candidatus Lokiarchaeia archaeon]
MPADANGSSDVPVHYVLDVLGNVLFVHVMRGVIAQVPVKIVHIPDVNGQRITAFFQRVAPELSTQILTTPLGEMDGPEMEWEITLDYKAKTCLATPFPAKLFPEEENLVLRLREADAKDVVELQMKNYLTKIDRIRQIYATAPQSKRSDPKWILAAVQKDFRKSPVTMQFIQFVIDTYSK